MSMNPSRTQRPRLRRSLALLALASSLAGLSPRAALAHADTQADTQVDTHAISRSELAALAATTHRARAGHAALAVDARGLAVEAVAAASGTAVDEPAPVPLRGTVNLNTASASTLELLPGVGPAIASRIVAYRDKHPFADVLHLMRVKGVGRKTFNRARPFLSVTGETTLESTR